MGAKKISINKAHEEKKRELWVSKKSEFRDYMEKVLPYPFSYYAEDGAISDLPKSIVKTLYDEVRRYHFPQTEFDMISRIRVRGNFGSSYFVKYNPSKFVASETSFFKRHSGYQGFVSKSHVNIDRTRSVINTGLLLHESVVYEDPVTRLFGWDNAPPDPGWDTDGLAIFKEYDKKNIESLRKDKEKLRSLRNAIQTNARLLPLIEKSLAIPVCTAHPFMVLVDRDEDDDGDCIMPSNFYYENALSLTYDGAEFSDVYLYILKKRFGILVDSNQKYDEKIVKDEAFRELNRSLHDLIWLEHFPGEYALLLEASEDARTVHKVAKKYSESIARLTEGEILPTFLLQSAFAVNGHELGHSEVITLRNDDEFISELKTILHAAAGIYRIQKKEGQVEEIEILRERLVLWGERLERNRRKSNFYQNLFSPSADAFFAGSGAMVVGLASGDPLTALMSGALGAISPNLLKAPLDFFDASGNKKFTVAVHKFVNALSAG